MQIIHFILMLTFFFGSVLQTEAKPPKEVKLRIDQQKTVPGTRIKIKFLAVTEDSRCPTGVNCVWAGNAKITIQLSKNGKASQTVELNSNLEPKLISFEGYEIKLGSVDPYPKSGIQIKPQNYTATLSLTKEP